MRFTNWADHTPFNLSRRRLCNPLGRGLGWAAHCCAISVARARAALTATFPRSIRSSPRRATFGAANSCSLVIFMIRPPTFGWWREPRPTAQITPTDRGLLVAVLNPPAALGWPGGRVESGTNEPVGELSWHQHDILQTEPRQRRAGFLSGPCAAFGDLRHSWRPSNQGLRAL